VTSLRGVANPSRSRIGREDETKSDVAFGNAAANSLAMVASVKPVSSEIFFAHRVANFFHCANHSSLAAWALRVGISVNRLSACLSLSTVAMRGSIAI